MTAIDMQPAGLKTRRKLHTSLGIDMTPMVDLGFLLISFFIFTTTLSEPRTTSLIMPADGDPIFVPESKSLTLLLAGNDQVIAYEGKWEDALQQNRLVPSGYAIDEGIGRLVRDKQQRLEKMKVKEGRDGLVLLIKATPAASYKNIIDALDETIINDVKKFMVVDADAAESAYACRFQ